MGTYLSFPLLCLQSHCAALWATRGRKSSHLVNGDDCLISCESAVTPDHYPPGFVINRKKTTVSRTVAEINSTCFIRGSKGFREVRHLRRGGAEPGLKGLLHQSAVCVAAGPVWESAFAKAHSRSSWDLCPVKDLKMSLSNSDVWRLARRRLLRGSCSLPPTAVDPDPRYSLVDRPLEPFEAVEVVIDLWDFGRSEASAPELPSRRACERARRRPFVPKWRGSLTTFRCDLASNRLRPRAGPDRRAKLRCGWAPAPRSLQWDDDEGVWWGWRGL